MKNFVWLVLFIWIIPKGFAQLDLSKFEQMDSLQKVEKRYVLVFIHTDWCKYCSTMKNRTFKNTKVIKEINEKFYFVEFDAEEKRAILFNNNTFVYKPSGKTSGVHELALQLGKMNDQISYPTLCFLNEKNEIVFQYNGFLNTKELLKILLFIK